MSPVGDVFRPGGALARAFEGFVTRPTQRRMAERIAAAMSQREHLLVEAGTGTGKTFAYLVPALTSGLRVLISTGTRTLQDQLYTPRYSVAGRGARPSADHGAAQGPRQLSVPGKTRRRARAAIPARKAMSRTCSSRFGIGRARRAAVIWRRSPRSGSRTRCAPSSPARAKPAPGAKLCGVLALSRIRGAPRGT